MAEPVTIGGQTFIKTGDGWIDKKTKQPADKGLIRLLSSFETTAPSPKLRVKIDKNREPITFSGTKYVYDLNQKGWIDQKSKILVPGNLQNILNNVSKPMAKPAAMGLAGQAAATKVKDKPTAVSGTGVIPIRKNINTPIVAMVEKLATIDGYLKQRLDNQKKIAKGELQALRESSIESQPDATPITQVSQGEEKKSNAGALLAVAGVAAIIASQFEPVQEAFKTVVDGVKGVFSYVGDFIKIMADGLGSLLGGDAAPSNSSPAVDATSVEKPTPTPSAPSVPGAQEVNTTTETPVATPSEPNEPNITAEGEKSQPDAASSSSTVGRTLAGAAIGATIGSTFGIKGAAIGSVIGGGLALFSGGPQRNAAPQMATPAQTIAPQIDATGESIETGGGGKLKDYVGKLFVLGGGRTGNLKNLENIDPEFEQQIIGALKEYTQNHPPPVMTSGYRYPGDQAAISGYMKAAPGKSRHERGLAMDFNSPDVNKMSSLGILRRHGLHQRYGAKDPVHIEQIGPAGEGVNAYPDGEDGGSLINRVTGTISDLGKGVIKAIGSIIKTGMGDYDIRSLGGDTATAEAITKSAIERNSAVAEEKSAKDGPVTLPNPVNINKNPEAATIENIPMPGDRAGVDFYLTRFGFPKIEYNQRAA